jgi:hypothetical protein
MKILNNILVMPINIFGTVIAGGLLTIMIAGPSFDNMGIALFAFLYLLPAIILYHIAYAFRLKSYICDIVYFIGYLSPVGLFIYDIETVPASSPDYVEGLGIVSGILFFLIYAGLSVYLIQIIVRSQERIKELGYKTLVDKTNWEDMFGQIFKHPKTICFSSIRSYIIAVIIISLIDIGQDFSDSYRIHLGVVVSGLAFSLFILPAIILYHSAGSLYLKTWIRDLTYFLTIFVVELITLFLSPNIRGNELPSFMTDYESHPYIIILWISLLAIFVYMAEVYFRNRAILKKS